MRREGGKKNLILARTRCAEAERNGSSQQNGVLVGDNPGGEEDAME